MKTRRNATMPQWPADLDNVSGWEEAPAHRNAVDEAAQSPRIAEVSSIKTTAKILKIDPGLYVLSVAAAGGPPCERCGITLPAFHIANPRSDSRGTAEIIAASGDRASWLGPEGGTVVIKTPLGGAHVMITTYEPDDQLGTPLEVEIRRLDPPSSEMVPTATANALRLAVTTREIKTEVLLHIERTGDRRFVAQGWLGNRGEKLRVEAFSVRPLETLATGDIEYKAFGPNARETPWVSSAKLCGTRGRGLPLTGFAIRLAAQLRDRFDVEYRGAFFVSGISDACRNGEPCKSRIADDPLEAVNIRLLERVS
jgi:hypothetical protein